MELSEALDFFEDTADLTKHWPDEYVEALHLIRKAARAYHEIDLDWHRTDA